MAIDATRKELLSLTEATKVMPQASDCCRPSSAYGSPGRVAARLGALRFRWREDVPRARREVRKPRCRTGSL